jgi:hypothetical protein
MSSFQATAGFPFTSANFHKTEAYFSWASLSLKTLLEVQQKNVAALTKAHRAVFDGMTTLIQRQGTLLKATADDCSRGTTQHAYESTVARWSELYEITAKAHLAAADILNARVMESLDDFKMLFAASTEPGPATAAEPTRLLVESVAVTATPPEPAPATVEELSLAASTEPVTPSEEPLPRIAEPAQDEEEDTPLPPQPAAKAPRAPRPSGSGAKAARRPTRG